METHSVVIGFHIFADGYAQFLHAERTANPVLETEPDAPPEKLLLRFATADVALLGSGPHGIAEAQFLRSFSARVTLVPGIALFLALSFGGYGLVRKLTPVDAVHGLALESTLLLVPSLGWILWTAWQATMVFMESSEDGVDTYVGLSGLFLTQNGVCATIIFYLNIKSKDFTMKAIFDKYIEEHS